MRLLGVAAIAVALTGGAIVAGRGVLAADEDALQSSFGAALSAQAGEGAITAEFQRALANEVAAGAFQLENDDLAAEFEAALSDGRDDGELAGPAPVVELADLEAAFAGALGGPTAAPALDGAALAGALDLEQLEGALAEQIQPAADGDDELRTELRGSLAPNGAELARTVDLDALVQALEAE